MTVVYPSGREVAQHEAHHVAALCLAGLVPKQVRTDWPGADLSGSVTVEWGNGPDRDKAKHVLVAILLGAMTEGCAGWQEWPIDPDRRLAVAIADELERVEVLTAQDLEVLIVTTEEKWSTEV